MEGDHYHRHIWASGLRGGERSCIKTLKKAKPRSGRSATVVIRPPKGGGKSTVTIHRPGERKSLG